MKPRIFIHAFGKILLSLILIFSSTFALSQSTTAAEWQEDLQQLKQVVHEEYPFLFKKISAEKWDSLVLEFDQQIPKLEPHEIIVGFARIVAAFQYGHTFISMSSTDIPIRALPLNLYQFEDGIYIQGIHKDYHEALGAKVVAVEGTPIAKALNMVKPAFPSENDQFFKAYGLRHLTSPEILHAQKVIPSLKQNITFTLEKNGNIFEQRFQSLDSLSIPTSYGFLFAQEDWLDVRIEGDTALYLKDLDRIYDFEYLADHKLVYVRQSQMQDDASEDIPTFYKKIFDFIDSNDVDKLVLDVRLNGGGNNYKNKPIITGIIKSEKINQIGKFFTIIGRRTFSACQNLVNELDNYTNVIFVGEPTGENINFYGDVNRIQLPKSNLSVRLSFAWWQDKPQWENGPWLAPHISVIPTFEDYVNNEDPTLDKILTFDTEDFIADPMNHFTNLFLAGKIDQLKSDAVKMVHDPRYQFFDFEEEFNTTGYNLLGRGQIKEAIFVFQMITDLFPDSANAWDSLAEGFWKAGDLEKAKTYYNKAIEIDPDGRIGANAKSNLSKIAQEEKH